MSTVVLAAAICLLSALFTNAAATAPAAINTNRLPNRCLPGDLDEYGSSDSSNASRTRPSIPSTSALSNGSSNSATYASARSGHPSITASSPNGAPSSDVRCSPPPPSSHPPLSFSLFRTPQSAPTSLHPTCSSMQFSRHLHRRQSSHLPAKSAIVDSASPPPLLTEEIHTLGDDALLCYEAVRDLHPLETGYDPTGKTPFSVLSEEDLERYFAAAADVKNALQLRKSVVGVDIGDALKDLLPKLSLYARDGAILETAFDEMRLIQEECLQRDLYLNFFYLEFFRCSLPSHTLSVLERYESLFTAMEQALDEKGEAQQATLSFLRDPSCLSEHRLLFSAFQR